MKVVFLYVDFGQEDWLQQLRLNNREEILIETLL